MLNERTKARVLLLMDEVATERDENGRVRRKGRVPYSRVHVYRKIAEGTFPRPIKLGTGQGGRIAFFEDEIDAYLSTLEAARDGQAA
jgi:predicted DNA-binding transcriptional regulator AlpA